MGETRQLARITIIISLLMFMFLSGCVDKLRPVLSQDERNKITEERISKGKIV